MSELRQIQSADLEYGKLWIPETGENVVPVITAEVYRFKQYGLAAISMAGYATRSQAEQLMDSTTTLATFTDCDRDSLLLATVGTSIRPREFASAGQLNYRSIDPTDPQRLLLPVVVVDSERLASDGLSAVLMQGFANRQAVRETMRTRKVTFWTRSRRELWQKGATSGNYLEARNIYTSREKDFVLIDAAPAGPTCHTGQNSCFETE